MNKAKPLKVLQVLHSLSMGGVETWLMELLRHWSSSGTVQMHFLLTGGIPGVFDDEVSDLGGEIHYLRYTRSDLGRFVPAYRQILAQGRFDAIHDHADLASGWHFLLACGLLPPVRVAHVHNPLLHLNGNYAVTPSRRAAASLGRSLVRRLATHVCGTSASALSNYGFQQHELGPKVSVLHCGFDIARFNAPRHPDRRSVLKEFGFPPNALIALFAGRLDRDLDIRSPRNHKNSWLAVLIARAASKRDKRVRVLIAGAGDDQRRAIQQHVDSWGLSDRVRLLGVRRDLPRLVRAADVLLFPSAEEGLGMVAVEAQAAGTPVLASTEIPTEAVVLPCNFKRVALSSSPDEWASNLIALMEKPRLPRGRAAEAFARSDFSIANSARALEAIYESARMAGRGKP